MSIIRRAILLGAISIAVAHPAAAQRGATGRGGAGGGKPTSGVKAKLQPKADTIKKPPPAIALDFQDQELRTVLDAIAAAGELNVTMAYIPSQRVTMHMGRPVNRDGMVELLKGLAESNGLKFTQTPTMIQISGPTPEPPQRQGAAQALAQQIAQANQQQQVRLFTYRLKHASAVQLAPVLTNLFSGATGTFRSTTTSQTVVPNPNGGFTVIGGNQGVTAGPPGNITTIPSPIQPNVGAGRGGAGRGNQNAPNAAADAAAVTRAALTNAFNNAFQAAGLSSQSGDIRIIAEESSNSLLVRATDSDWALVQSVVQGVDLRPLQVLIEVTIAEVQRTHDLDIGVSGNVKRIPKGKTAADVTGTEPSAASARDFILALSGGNGTIKYDVAIAALQERGDVRVLSMPVIIAQNNRQAQLNVGSSRPFVQVSQTVPNDPTGRVQTVQYIDVGTVLTITPTINPDGYVNLQVQQQDNSATNQIQFDAPIINKREATTQVFIRDGQTTVIGGLADNSRTRDASGIPFLSRIPFIGPLIFGRTTRSDATRELFLFLTPHIITSDEDIDKLRNAVRDGSDLLKEIEVGPRLVPKADTLKVKPDSVKKDSLTTLRRRPPEDTASSRAQRGTYSVAASSRAQRGTCSPGDYRVAQRRSLAPLGMTA